MATEPAKTFDAVVIGGGPAGATVGRLLAEWGYSVLLLSKSQGQKPSLAECLPPSIRKLFRFLGILGEIDRAGFYRTSGNTVWWGEAGARVENYPGPPSARGYQVLRADFDKLLLALAEKAGAAVRPDASVRRVDLAAGEAARVEYGAPDGTRARVAAKFVLDCSGRAGVIARQGFRVNEPRHRTLALAGVWRREDGWGLEEESHTLVETYDDGWAWSVPVSAAVRHFTVMVDLRDTRIARGKQLPAIYRAELDKTRSFKKILAGATPQAAPWGCDASLYTARCFAGPRFLLVGDAGSFIDPLSSFGVKKALVSAWMGAVGVNTCLKRPAMQPAALEFFSGREQQVYASHFRLSQRYYREAAASHPTGFWTRRCDPALAGAGDDWDEQEQQRAPQVLAALEALRKSPSIRLQRAEDVRIEKQPGIVGREVVLEQALVKPGLARGIRFLKGVNVPALAQMAGEHTQVPDLFEAYNRRCPPVALPDFLGSLAVLLATGVLRNEVGLAPG